MILRYAGPLGPLSLLQTSFHLPSSYSPEDVEDFLSEISNMMLPAGAMSTGPIITVAESHIIDHNHFQAVYLFKSTEEAKAYTQSTTLGVEIRNKFTAKYGDDAKERKRYLNGVQL